MNVHQTIAAPAVVLAIALAVSACSTERTDASKRIEPEYDSHGRLQLLKYDSKGNGRVDTWSYMDGARVVRIEIDRDGDGRIDRVEYYEHDVVAGVEEDTDADGRIDKWETYEGARMSSVAFDTLHQGVPDRRLTYGPGGAASIEVDLEGDGHLLPRRAAAASPHPGVR